MLTFVAFLVFASFVKADADADPDGKAEALQPEVDLDSQQVDTISERISILRPSRYRYKKRPVVLPKKLPYRLPKKHLEVRRPSSGPVKAKSGQIRPRKVVIRKRLGPANHYFTRPAYSLPPTYATKPAPPSQYQSQTRPKKAARPGSVPVIHKTPKAKDVAPKKKAYSQYLTPYTSVPKKPYSPKSYYKQKVKPLHQQGQPLHVQITKTKKQPQVVKKAPPKAVLKQEPPSKSPLPPRDVKAKRPRPGAVYDQGYRIKPSSKKPFITVTTTQSSTNNKWNEVLHRQGQLEERLFFGGRGRRRPHRRPRPHR